MKGGATIGALLAWARRLKRDVAALWIAARDGRVPWGAKAVAGLIVAYALSPIDLIPDVIPVLGYLDEAIILPLGVALAVRLVPRALMEEFRAEALKGQRRPVSVVGAVIVVAAWIAASVWLAWLFWPTPAP